MNLSAAPLSPAQSALQVEGVEGAACGATPAQLLVTVLLFIQNMGTKPPLLAVEAVSPVGAHSHQLQLATFVGGLGLEQR